MSLQNNGFMRIGEYEIDRAQWRLSWQEEPIVLNRKTFDLLLYLADHSNAVVSKQELMQALWPEQFIEDSNLTQHVFLLRKALSRHTSGEKIIETVPGRGYRLAAPVSGIDPVIDSITIDSRESITHITIEEEPFDSPALALSEPQSQRLTSSAARLTLVAAIALGLGMAVWYGWRQWQDRTGGPPVQVVLTPLEGTTGDPVLDRSLLNVLRMNVSQSPFVSLLPDSLVSETLTQMTRNPHDPLTVVTAREVCERTNSQAVVHGSIARSGRQYLLTEEATSCVDGKTIAEASREVKRAEDLPHAVELLGERMRKGMGESRRSIARYSAQLIPSNTASLEALKYYSLAKTESEQGKFPDAIALLKKAVVADPSFAAGYYDLAATYGSMEDFTSERESVAKAYAMRESASEPVRFAITALYSSVTTQDLYESERNYRDWTELYPRAAQAWNGLSNTQRELGKAAESAASAKRVVELHPENQGMYANLSYMQVRAGDARGAQITCEQAIARGLDGEHIRVNCLDAAFALKDSASIKTQTDWGTAHPESVTFEIEELELALSEGRFADAHRLLLKCADLFRQQGLPGAAATINQMEGSNLIEAGDVDAGLRLFRSKPADSEDSASVYGLALAGDFAAAETAVRAMRAKYPEGTLWNLYVTPYVHALHAMAQHKPQEALDALETSRPLEGRDFGHTLVRADAYLAAGQPAQAEKEYRTILNERAREPIAIELPISWLGLGRALAAEGKMADAISAYQQFLSLWAHADPDAAFLRQGKLELAALQTKSAR